MAMLMKWKFQSRSSPMKHEPTWLSHGDRVRLDYDPRQVGTVVGAGLEQSEVRWDGSRRSDVRVHPNKDLIRLVDRVRSNRSR